MFYCLDVTKILVAGLSSFTVSLAFSAFFIRFFHGMVRSSIRTYVAQLHHHKDQTPTMGGLPMIAAILVVAAFFYSSERRFLACLSALPLFGACGFWDDWAKIKRGKGIMEVQKWLALIIAGCIVLLIWWPVDAAAQTLVMPFLKLVVFRVGAFFGLWGLWILLCTTNAVNFTDGLDGLAAILLMIAFTFFGGLALLFGAPDLALFAALCLGSVAGFLWFNAHPARIFMGDVGSLAFGGALGILALVLKMELLLPLVGIIFVVEVLSVLIQRYGLRWFGKRLFKMAPLHHHFELLGWHETLITTRFMLVACIASFITLLLLLPVLCAL